MTYANIYWLTALLYFAIDSIFESPHRTVANRIILAYTVLVTILTGMLPIHLYSRYIAFFEGIGFLLVLFALAISVKAYFQHERGSGLIVGAVFFVFTAGIHDILYESNMILSSFGELLPIGMFLIMLAFAFISANRLKMEFNRSRALSVQLAEALEKEKTSSKVLMASELAFLKAQIRPHFIYNSLSTIAALTEEEPQKAKALLYHLIDVS